MFVANVVSTLLKAISVTGTNATSVFIDMLNDVGDTMGLGLLLLGISFEKKKRSILYPYGRRRALYVVGLISMSIFSGSIFYIALTKVFNSMREYSDLTSLSYSKYAFLAAFTVNIITLFVLFIGSKENNRRDPVILSGLIDVVSDVCGGAIALCSILLKSSLVDTIGSLLLSFVILISALTIGYRYFLVLIGRAPPRYILRGVLEKVLAINEVKDVNIFNALMITEDEFMLVLEVEVDRKANVESLEKLSDHIEREVKSLDPRFKHVIIEFVAERREPPTYKNILIEIES